jgi:hypothetical protein
MVVTMTILELEEVMRMVTKREISPLGYPLSKRGGVMGAEKFDSDNLPTEDQVRRSHSPGWVENRLARARKACWRSPCRKEKGAAGPLENCRPFLPRMKSARPLRSRDPS